MPAVLLEAGSIVNRKEELELVTDDRRTLTANAVTAAVADFCEMRAHPSGERRPSTPLGEADSDRPRQSCWIRALSLPLQQKIISAFRNKSPSCPVLSFDAANKQHDDCGPA
jgi:hypothetical protein